MPETADIFVIDGENAPTESPYEFDSLAEDAGNAFELDTPGIHGNGRYKISFGGTNDGSFGLKSISGQTEVYYRVYFYFPTGAYPHVGQGALQNFKALEIDRVGGYASRVRFSANNAGAQLTVLEYYDTDFHYPGLGPTPISIGMPHYLEQYYKIHATEGAVKLWFDGTLLSNNTGLDTSGVVFTNILTGSTYSSPVPANGEYFYIDDILAATTGPIGAYKVPLSGIIPVQSALSGSLSLGKKLSGIIPASSGLVGPLNQREVLHWTADSAKEIDMIAK